MEDMAWVCDNCPKHAHISIASQRSRGRGWQEFTSCKGSYKRKEKEMRKASTGLYTNYV